MSQNPLQFPQYSGFDLPEASKKYLAWQQLHTIFEKSINSRSEATPFVFFEGPPSANGLPGIHHVMARAIKDIFCRYKTLQGFQVNRKAGWDTHGLPVELGVEKELGITKEDIGKKITVEEYNDACKKAVMKYTHIWNDLTEKMGYWVDMKNPYVTYETKYMESVWWLLKQLYDKNLLYKGYTIQPYSPKAGTGLSSHELNQPGCYKDVTDTTIIAQFKLTEDSKSKIQAVTNEKLNEDVFFLAWTTTPWTLPSNTALAVGKNIEYVLVKTFNQYTFEPINVILAKSLVSKQFAGKFTAAANEEDLSGYNHNDKKIPYFVALTYKGSDLLNLKYEQLLPYALPHENSEQAFRVIAGDFVTTEDGTGIVHIAPTFGADDAKVAKDAGVPPMLVLDENQNPVPLVDLQGKFRSEMAELGGMYVKNEYYEEGTAPEKSVDVLIAIQLKEKNRAFNVEKYKHSYPHCWRTDKPVLYYPLDSWFIRVTDKKVKSRMIELNKTIHWKPESTGTGRFGNWLENANDWNLSRSRYWGIPIPIWRTEDGTESACIGSVEELKIACESAVKAGVMAQNPLEKFIPNDFSKDNYNLVDLHKNYVDEIVLVSPSGKPMKREADLIDVWFDSGAMPYAQWHYPFENKDLVEKESFPADFIAEGVDQTRGWFYTLHAIATMCFDSVAYKAVVSNGLVLDKNGQKMSKRLGNAVDPFKTIEKYGADATRWYMITNAQPWDNLKFDEEGIVEVQRKFFRALHNTYAFFSLYANIDNVKYEEQEITLHERPEIDRWILSKLHSLIKNVAEAYDSYDPTKAGRLIQEFVVEDLSNWYVRLCRRRFWKGNYTEDKISAYQTLYTCLENVAIISSPIAPFYTEQLFNDLNIVTCKVDRESVHLCDFPMSDSSFIDLELEEKMAIAQKVSSLTFAIRKKEKIKVRQPLQKMMIPALSADFANKIESVRELILSEVNVKEMIILTDATDVLVKKIKPNFKALGPKVGKLMKHVAGEISKYTQADIASLEEKGFTTIEVNGEKIQIDLSDTEITSEDIPGWSVVSEGKYTVALDVSLTEELISEGVARELINRIQNLRKDKGLDVVDKISLQILKHEFINDAVNKNLDYICSETLASSLELVSEINTIDSMLIELDEEISTRIVISKN